MKIDYIDYSSEVLDALKSSAPVVALESTIIAHGMPYPRNLETALNVEKIIREEGSVPATMAIIDGRIKIGLSENDLQFLAKSKNVLKASRRDFPSAVALKQNAATTVATTMICARLAGIRIFCTGGIGGVHRGAETSFDISADLQELAGTNVAVVSAGAKSILNLSLTLEYLETMGVPVYGYRTDEFPAFFTRQSGLPVTCRMDSPGDIASALSVKWELGLTGGVLIANPVPEEHSMDKNHIDNAIEKAVSEAAEKGITGKDVTPYLLSAIARITGGESLSSNIELVYNNARVASRIAVIYNRIKKEHAK